MMKLVIGNKTYSSWSMRGWLACRQSGLPFEEIIVPIHNDDWSDLKKEMGDIQPSQGKVPVLWDGDAVVWDSLAISNPFQTRWGVTGSGPRRMMPGRWRDRWWRKCTRHTCRCAASAR